MGEIIPAADRAAAPRVSALKPTTNYDRLLAVLEGNAASASEPELVRRLRDAIRAIRSGSQERD